MRALQIIPNKLDKSILIKPERPSFSLIWLHGLGDSSVGFLDYFQIPQSPVFRGCRVRLLNAPQRRVTINGGTVFNSWYDIRSFAGSGKDEERYNLEEIKDSLAIIEQNVAGEVAFWKEQDLKETQEQICRRIFLGGFSQGCAMSLTFGLTSKRLLGGIVGFSGHLFDSFPLVNKGKVPVLAYHGGQDDVLSYKWVKAIYDRHMRDCPSFDFRLIPDLSHSVTVEQLEESTRWMEEQLKKHGISAMSCE